MNPEDTHTMIVVMGSIVLILCTVELLRFFGVHRILPGGRRTELAAVGWVIATILRMILVFVATFLLCFSFVVAANANARGFSIDDLFKVVDVEVISRRKWQELTGKCKRAYAMMGMDYCVTSNKWGRAPDQCVCDCDPTGQCTLETYDDIRSKYRELGEPATCVELYVEDLGMDSVGCTDDISHGGDQPCRTGRTITDEEILTSEKHMYAALDGMCECYTEADVTYVARDNDDKKSPKLNCDDRIEKDQYNDVTSCRRDSYYNKRREFCDSVYAYNMPYPNTCRCVKKQLKRRVAPFPSLGDITVSRGARKCPSIITEPGSVDEMPTACDEHSIGHIMQPTHGGARCACVHLPESARHLATFGGVQVNSDAGMAWTRMYSTTKTCADIAGDHLRDGEWKTERYQCNEANAKNTVCYFGRHCECGMDDDGGWSWKSTSDDQRITDEYPYGACGGYIEDEVVV